MKSKKALKPNSNLIKQLNKLYTDTLDELGLPQMCAKDLRAELYKEEDQDLSAIEFVEAFFIMDIALCDLGCDEEILINNKPNYAERF
jgi:hypothetical protein